MKTFDLHSVDMRVVQNKKKWFLIPLIVLVIAIIMGTIFGVTGNGVFNVGVDFTGGYSLTVTLGESLDDANARSDYEERITHIIENASEYSDYSDDLIGVNGFAVRDISAQGEGADKALRVQFTASGYSDLEMVGTGTDGDEGIIGALCDAIYGELHDENDIFGVNVTSGDRTTATVSMELIVTAVCGILMSLALMLVYVAVRFEIMSGVVALMCLVHDAIMMFLFMCIFHIELASTFVAAVITILGYSINNTIIIFDMIRSKTKTEPNSSPLELANTSVRDTLIRSINTTATTFVTVAMIAVMSAIFGVGDLLTFCLPLMAGLIAGMFSSVLLAPTIWAVWKQRQLNKAAAAPAPRTMALATAAASAAPTDGALESFFAGSDTMASTTPSAADSVTDPGQVEPASSDDAHADAPEANSDETEPDMSDSAAEEAVNGDGADVTGDDCSEMPSDDAPELSGPGTPADTPDGQDEDR